LDRLFRQSNGVFQTIRLEPLKDLASIAAAVPFSVSMIFPENRRPPQDRRPRAGFFGIMR
jgi:hypothetical protein